MARRPSKVDAIIIGSGQAGNLLANRFAELGRQAAMIEKGNVAGTCVNTGRTLTKTMVHRAQSGHCAQNGAAMMKVIVDAANNRILGAAVRDSGGGELVHVFYTLKLGNVPYALLKGTAFIHPTLCEGFFTLLDSAKPVG